MQCRESEVSLNASNGHCEIDPGAQIVRRLDYEFFHLRSFILLLDPPEHDTVGQQLGRSKKSEFSGGDPAMSCRSLVAKCSLAALLLAATAITLGAVSTGPDAACAKNGEECGTWYVCCSKTCSGGTCIAKPNP